MASAAFKSLCETLLSKGDLSIMTNLSLDPQPLSKTGKKRISQDAENIKVEGPAYARPAPSTGCSFVDNWNEWERVLRLNVAKNRAIKKEREDLILVEPPLVPQDAANAAAKAVNSESPLDGEMIIDKARWNVIDNLVGIGYFNRKNVFAYFLKLLLLERRQSFNAERGFAEYKTLYASIIDRYGNDRNVENTGRT